MTAATYLEPPLSDARVGGLRMTWREAGQGEATPLFLMHGVGTNARLWAGQFAAFSGQRRVIGWNAPGYGGSDPVAPPSPGADDYGRAALALLDHLRIERCIVVAQSLGCVMATDLTLRAPDRVAALALTSPAAGHAVAPGDPLPEAMQRRLDDVAALPPAVMAAQRAPHLLSAAADPRAVAIVQQAMSELDPGAYAQAVRMWAGADLVALARKVRTPLLVMWGAADTITPPAECRRVAEAAGHAERHELPGLGHAMAAEDPAAFNAVLAAFIQTLRTQSHARADVL